MPAVTVPSIDNLNLDWTEQDRNLFNKIPTYFQELQAKQLPTWETWSKVVGDLKWKPNAGTRLRVIRKEPSPHIRTFAFPNLISERPAVDVIDTREVGAEVEPVWQDFESLVFNFLPDFRDFMTNHVKFNATDINEKMLRFSELIIRTSIFHQAQYVALPGAATEVVDAPTAAGNAAGTAAGSKNLAWLQDVTSKITDSGLSVKKLGRLVSAFSEDIGAPYFEGGMSAPKDNQATDGKYLMIGGAELYRSWLTDPYVLANRPLAMNVVTEKWKGTPFDDVVYRTEKHPIRFKKNEPDGSISIVAPQKRIVGGAWDGQTIPDPDYTAAEFEAVTLLGADGWKAIKPGPPPAMFRGGATDPGISKMFWNGETKITDDILVPTPDVAGNVRWTANNRGRYLQILGTVAGGCLGYNTRNALVIIFKRNRGFN